MTKLSRRAALAAIVGLMVAGATSCSHYQGGSTSGEAKLDQAAAFGHRGDFSSAVRLASEVIDQQPSDALAYVVRGAAHRRSGAYSEAIADLDRAIELDPQIADAYTQRAFACQQGHSNASSKQIFADLNRAIELDSS